MKWPFKHQAVSDNNTPFFNLLYLCARGSGAPDSTIVWTSEIPWQPSQDYIQEYKTRHSRFINTSHVLVQAVGHGLAEHPVLNRRVVGRRIHEFKDCHVSLATRVPGNDEVFVIQIHNPDSRPLHEIAYIIMMRQLDFARSDAHECRDLERLRKLPNWLTRCTLRFADWMDKKFVMPVVGRIDRFRESGVLVNDFSSKRFPIMRGYKPSRQPGESKPLSVTLGPPEDKVIWKDGAATVEKVAPITVRVDHRICDSFNLSQFLKTVIEKMTHPSLMEPAIIDSSSAKPPNTMPTTPALPRLSA